MDPILFSENQRFNQWWLWVVIAIGPIMELYFGINSISLNAPFKDIFWSIIFPILIVSVVASLLLMLKLKTIVTQYFIEVAFGPFKTKSRYYFNELKECTVRQYKPLAEYGGWGIRYSRNGKAYNIRGNFGLQLVLNSGQRILIGTQQPEKLKEVVASVFQQ